MRAAKLYAPGDVRLVEVEKPSPGYGEVLVRVEEVGVCASDVHWFRDGRIGETVLTEPLILGHEFGGVIAEVGPEVDDLNPGDRVAVEPAIPCSECDMCMAGDINLCRNIRFCGTPPTDGAFREFIAWPARLVAPVPDSMTMSEVAMLEPLAIGVYAAEIAGSLAGKTVGVVGAGAIGLSILQAARAASCGETYVTDLIPERLELARRLGAEHAFDASNPAVAEDVKAATGGRGLDVVFEAAGENDALCQAVDVVRPGGLMLVGGIPRDDHMSLPASISRRKGLTIKTIRRSKNTLHRSIELIRQGKVDVASFVTHTFPLERVVEALETARDRRDGVLRAVVEAG